MKIATELLWAAIFAAGFVGAAAIVDSTVDKKPPPCKEFATITLILEHRHKQAVVQLSDGTVKTMYGVVIRPGDSVCIRPAY